ncbi:MAG: DUF721 domain-containing protein [Bacillota bacterium]|nr:DUF721 domain-containing protein [Bacillota bacterium]
MGISDLRSLVRAITGALESQPARVASRLWPEVAGEQLASRTWVSSVRGDTMFIVAVSSVWAQQLQLMERDLLFRLREAAGQDCPIKRLRFRAGGRPPAAELVSGPDDPSLAGERHPDRKPPADAVAAAATQAAARRAAREVADADLARALERALRAQSGAQQWPLPAGAERPEPPAAR